MLLSGNPELTMSVLGSSERSVPVLSHVYTFVKSVSWIVCKGFAVELFSMFFHISTLRPVSCRKSPTYHEQL